MKRFKIDAMGNKVVQQAKNILFFNEKNMIIKTVKHLTIADAKEAMKKYSWPIEKKRPHHCARIYNGQLIMQL